MLARARGYEKSPGSRKPHLARRAKIAMQRRNPWPRMQQEPAPHPPPVRAHRRCEAGQTADPNEISQDLIYAAVSIEQVEACVRRAPP